MCGIAGAVGNVDPSVAAAVERMSTAQSHRGPDSHGSWTSSLDPNCLQATFAHRRLAIIDLSPGGHQPMLDPETGNVICYNGEIYNYRDLREELISLGCTFRTDSDTEVVLKAFSVWGDDCFGHLRGMFSIAIWDARTRSVTLARDRLGIKPLYLLEVGRPGGSRTLLFASEIRALLESGLVERRIDPVGLATYLWNGFVVSPHTIVKSARPLRPGAFLRISDPTSLRQEVKYWDLPSDRGASGSSEELGEALSEAVRLRLVSDVPLGVFLSGGIDSSAMATLAAKVSSNAIQTFNISFDEAEFDEAPYAKRVADSIGSEHSEIRLSQQLFMARLEDALGSLDQPTFDAINTYFVSRAVREAGITVAISGAGGDELFGGYTSFSDLPRARPWAGRLSFVPEWVSKTLMNSALRLKAIGGNSFPPQTRYGKLVDVIASQGRMVDIYQVSYALYTRSFLGELGRSLPELDAPWGLPPERRVELEKLIEGSSELHAISLLELSCFIGERLLRDTDTASMAVALEVRVPLLDHEVVERAASLDSADRYSPIGKKQLLRDLALSDLDPEIFDRPKSGFVLPIERWSRAALRGEIEAALINRTRCEACGLDPDSVMRLWRAYEQGAPGIYWSRIWAIFVLLRWTTRHRMSL